MTPGDLDGILEGHEEPRGGPLVGIQFEEIHSVEEDGPVGDFIGFIAGEDLREGALARSVWPHEGMDLSVVDGEVDAPKNRRVIDGGV